MGRDRIVSAERKWATSGEMLGVVFDRGMSALQDALDRRTASSVSVLVGAPTVEHAEALREACVDFGATVSKEYRAKNDELHPEELSDLVVQVATKANMVQLTLTVVERSRG